MSFNLTPVTTQWCSLTLASNEVSCSFSASCSQALLSFISHCRLSSSPVLFLAAVFQLVFLVFHTHLGHSQLVLTCFTCHCCLVLSPAFCASCLRLDWMDSESMSDGVGWSSTMFLFLFFSVSFLFPDLSSLSWLVFLLLPSSIFLSFLIPTLLTFHGVMGGVSEKVNFHYNGL